MTRVALIYPWDSHSYYRPKYPCIGLGYLSSFLKHEEIDTLAIDAKFDGLDFEEVKELLIEFNPDILGFTAMTHEICTASSWASKLKNLFPRSLFIIGGAHSTAIGSKILVDFPVFDIAVVGEGEITLLEIAELSTKSIQMHLSEIKGIIWQKNNNIIINESRPLISNLDLLPYPDYDHIKSKLKAYPIFTSRGCPNQCIFCCRILGNKIRTRSPKNVFKEIKFAIETYEPELIEIADDTFTIPKERVMEICNLMIEEGLNKKVKWFALSRVNGVDQELFYKMKEAGCAKIDFGVESGNEEILKTIKKGISIADAQKAIKMAKKAGLKTGCYFIIGHPNETVKTIKETIKLAAELNPSVISFGIMVPYPGTEIYHMAQKGEGNYRLISQNWMDYDKQIGNALEIVNLPRKELEKWQKKAYIYFYIKNIRFKDLLYLGLSQKNLAVLMLKKTIRSY